MIPGSRQGPYLYYTVSLQLPGTEVPRIQLMLRSLLFVCSRYIQYLPYNHPSRFSLFIALFPCTSQSVRREDLSHQSLQGSFFHCKVIPEFLPPSFGVSEEGPLDTSVSLVCLVSGFWEIFPVPSGETDLVGITLPSPSPDVSHQCAPKRAGLLQPKRRDTQYPGHLQTYALSPYGTEHKIFRKRPTIGRLRNLHTSCLRSSGPSQSVIGRWRGSVGDSLLTGSWCLLSFSRTRVGVPGPQGLSGVVRTMCDNSLASSFLFLLSPVLIQWLDSSLSLTRYGPFIVSE